MRRRPPQLFRSGRSSRYSESKYTNWTDFDPYEGEISQAPYTARRVRTLPGPGGRSCRLYERPLHPAFVRPYTADEVVRVLTAFPEEVRAELDAVCLMGGTAAQLRVRSLRLARFGSYGRDWSAAWWGWRVIWLFAFPRWEMVVRYRGWPAPHIRQEYERAGARYEAVGSRVVRYFSEEALRLFYLSDTLVHELAHHVDRHTLYDRPDRDAERFADAFVREHAPRIRRLLQHE